MKVTVKAGGLFTKRLPEGTVGTTAEMEVADGATVIDVLGALGIETDGRFMLSVNGQSVPPAERAQLTLNDGDQVAIMPPLKGG